MSKVGQNSPQNHDEFLRNIKDYSIVFISVFNILYLPMKVFAIIIVLKAFGVCALAY
jgi:hypothetical protein